MGKAAKINPAKAETPVPKTKGKETMKAPIAQQTVAPRVTPVIKTATDVTKLDYRKLPSNYGQQAVAAFVSVKDAEDTIKSGRRQTLEFLTTGIWKAGMENSKLITDMASVYGTKSERDDIREEVRVALGMRKRTKDKDGAVKLEWNDWVFEYFPAPGEDEKTRPDYAKRRDRAKNFSRQLDKCIGAAYALLTMGMAPKQKVDGPFMITGPNVKEYFGTDEVSIDEKQQIIQTTKDGTVLLDENKKPKVLDLKRKPSFTELNRIGAESLGKVVKVRKQSERPTGYASASEQEILELLASLTSVLQSPTQEPKVIAALHNLYPKFQAAVERFPEVEEDEIDEEDVEEENAA